MNSQSRNTYEHCKNINCDTLLEKYSDLFRYFGVSVSGDHK